MEFYIRHLCEGIILLDWNITNQIEFLSIYEEKFNRHLIYILFERKSQRVKLNKIQIIEYLPL